MAENVELKPCPFCGCDDIAFVDRAAPAHIANEVKLFELRCVKCTANFQGYILIDANEETANAFLAKKWNTRA
jgi:Lar family restriction alleviation protein